MGEDGSVAGVVSLAEAVTHFRTAIDELAAASTGCVSDAELVQAWRQVETGRRRLEPLDHALINDIDQRSLSGPAGCTSTAVFARQVLRLHPGEAAARVSAAAALGPRRAPSGQLIDSIYPATAAAQAAGDISARHAAIIVATIEKLPDDVRAVMDRTVENLLLDTARSCDPRVLAQFARDLAYSLDQDGQYRDHDRQQRRRDLRLRRRPDGSGQLDGQLTAECAEYLETMLDALAQPTPATENGTKDLRTPGQRRHDALLDMLHLTTRAQLLPNVGGVTATIVLHMDADTYLTRNTTGTGDTGSYTGSNRSSSTGAGGAGAGSSGCCPDAGSTYGTSSSTDRRGSRVGVATTGHGYTIPADIAARWAGADTRLIATLLSSTKTVEAYSATHRIFTEHQRLAMAARDGGCSFPTCDRGPNWCESHHMTEYRLSRRTTIDDGTLLCRYHHAHFEETGWTGIMINKQPYWIPPHHIDPNQTPRRNTMHDRNIDTGCPDTERRDQRCPDTERPDHGCPNTDCPD